MKARCRIILVLAGTFCTGMLCGAIFHSGLTPTHVHAQDQLNSLAGCIAAVPKAWGEFRGASSEGLAFEDQDGTLRLVQHPACSLNNSVSNIPTSAIDLEILRK